MQRNEIITAYNMRLKKTCEDSIDRLIEGIDKKSSVEILIIRTLMSFKDLDFTKNIHDIGKYEEGIATLTHMATYWKHKVTGDTRIVLQCHQALLSELKRTLTKYS